MPNASQGSSDGALRTERQKKKANLAAAGQGGMVRDLEDELRAQRNLPIIAVIEVVIKEGACKRIIREVIDVRVRSTPELAVQDVGGVRLQLQGLAFENFDVLEDTQIDVVNTLRSKRVARYTKRKPERPGISCAVCDVGLRKIWVCAWS